MPKLSIDNRLFIVEKRNEGQGYNTIRKLLHDQKGVTVTKRAVRNLCLKAEQTGSVADKRRHGRSKLNEEQKQYLDRLIQDKPDSTAKELATKLQEEYNVVLHRSTVSRARKQLGYTSAAVKYCQMIRNTNKDKRLEWCREMQEAHEEFNVSIYKLSFTLKGRLAQNRTQ